MFWTGGPGAPPPPPPPPVTPSEAARLQRNDGKRNKGGKESLVSPNSQLRTGELEKLRQRGLAKLLNRHFTTVTQTIAQERAAADAALRELEEKSKNMKQYKTTYGEMTPYEEAYIALKKKRDDCKRKEKETLLLYQRYVNKFGTTDYITVPNPKLTQATASPYHNYNGRPADAIAPVAGEKYLPANLISSALNSDAMPRDKTALMTTDIETRLDKHLETLGAERLPSIGSMGIGTTHQSKQAATELNDRKFQRRELESRGIDASSPGGIGKPPLKPSNNPLLSPAAALTLPALVESSPSSDETPSTPIRNTPIKQPLIGSDSPITNISVSDSAAELHKQGITEIPFSNRNDEDDDDDLSSLVSGLTPETCAFVQNDAEQKLLEFLKNETDAIKKMLKDDEESSMVSKSTLGTAVSSAAGNTKESDMMSETQRAAQRAEEMAKEMEKILADAKNDAESVYSSTDAESLMTSSTITMRQPTNIKTTDPNESWIRYYDDTHKRYYYHEKKSNKTQWEKPYNMVQVDTTIDETTADANGTPKAKTARQQQSDETYVPLKDYTKVKSSSRSISSSSRSITGYDDASTSSRPSLYSKSSSTSINTKSSGISASRRVLYRRKQRRKRRRRRIVMTIAGLSIIGGSIYYLKQGDNAKNAEKSINNLMLLTVHPSLPDTFKWNENKTTFIDAIDEAIHVSMSKNVNPYLPKSLQYLSTRVIKRNEETKRQRLLRERQIQEEANELKRIQAEAEAKKLAEEEEKTKNNDEAAAKKKQKEEEEKARVEAQKKKQKEEEEEKARAEEEKARVEAQKKKLKEEEEARRLAKEEEERRLQRPGYCNIPLFYLLNKRCWELASESPIYNLIDLVNSMMQ